MSYEELVKNKKLGDIPASVEWSIEEKMNRETGEPGEVNIQKNKDSEEKEIPEKEARASVKEETMEAISSEKDEPQECVKESKAGNQKGTKCRKSVKSEILDLYSDFSEVSIVVRKKDGTEFELPKYDAGRKILVTDSVARAAKAIGRETDDLIIAMKWSTERWLDPAIMPEYVPAYPENSK